MAFIWTFFFLSLCFLSHGLPILPVCYISGLCPIFKQYDQRWGHDKMNTSTIAQQGCAMSSISMALHAFRFTIDHQEITPGTLNQWLRDNHGYICIKGNCNNLRLNALEEIAPGYIIFKGEASKPSWTNFTIWMDHFRVCILHVNNNHHFVWAIGYDTSSETVYIRDPNHFVISKEYFEISDIILYDFIFR